MLNLSLHRSVILGKFQWPIEEMLTKKLKIEVIIQNIVLQCTDHQNEPLQKSIDLFNVSSSCKLLMGKKFMKQLLLLETMCRQGSIL